MRKLPLLLIPLFFVYAAQAQIERKSFVFPDRVSLEADSATDIDHPTQLARFEHVFTVLDEETVQAVRKSAYMQAFSEVTQKTLLSDEGHAHGSFIAGEENYVELFGPKDLDIDGPTCAPGLLGIGLNTERINGLEPIMHKLHKSSLPFEIRSFHRPMGNRQVDWFRGLALPSSLDGSVERSGKPETEIFISEYFPSYLDIPEANKPAAKGKDDIVSLRRYHQNDYYHRLMKNVCGLKLAITSEDWSVFKPMLESSGYKISEHNSGASATGDIDITLLFVQRENVGVRRIDFILNEGVHDKHIEILGHSRLEVASDAHAVWTFDPNPTDPLRK
jgi:hypothetical protein